MRGNKRDGSKARKGGGKAREEKKKKRSLRYIVGQVWRGTGRCGGGREGEGGEEEGRRPVLLRYS